ncbi:MAG: hypothetical protein BMS9Abin29_2068 [Gemmatimonadota bacterium]|nr:MAG: hypothetical protein BMS9Abin29_2068 [Gemmatimonadota bacterium]
MKKCWLVPVAGLLLVACGETITAPDAVRSMDETTATAVAAAVVEASDAKLPYLPALVRQALAAIEAGGDHAEAVTAFRRARHARHAANAALVAGNADEYKRLKRIELRFTLRGVIAALGPSVVTDALSGVDAAIAHWEQRTAGRDVPPRFARVLEQVKELAERARTADSQIASLFFSVRATEVILSLSPRHVARRAIGKAALLFRAARAAVGDSPTEDEVAALRRAHHLLGSADGAFAAKEWRRAIRAAKASAELSQGVLDGRAQ